MIIVRTVSQIRHFGTFSALGAPSIFAPVKKSPLLLLFLLLLSVSAWAQKIVVSKDFNNLGSPYKEGYEWELPPDKPLVISFLYQQDKTIINHTSVIFKVECLTDAKVPIQRIRTQVGQGRSWVARRHDIDKPGTYRVSVFIDENKVFAQTEFVVKGVRNPPPPPPAPKPVAQEKPKEKPKPAEPAKPEPKAEEPKPIQKIEMTAISPTAANVAQKDLDVDMLQPIFVEPIKEPIPEKFRFMYIAHGRSVKAGMLTGQNEKFKLAEGGVDITTMFTNTEEFGIDKVTVRIWRKGRDAKDYAEVIAEKPMSISPAQTSVHTNYVYNRPGDYKVSIFDDQDKLIGTSYVRFYIFH